MRSSELSSRVRTALTDYIHVAAELLRADIVGGAEVPFELAPHRGRSGAKATLYCYEPLTREFIAERDSQLAALAEHDAAVAALVGMQGLDSYLASRGAPSGLDFSVEDRRPRIATRSRSKPAGTQPGGQQAKAVLKELLADIFEGQTDFDPRAERVDGALERLAQAELAGATGTVTIIATLHGVTIASDELALTKGLTIAAPEALRDLPEALRAGGEEREEHLLVALVLDAAVGGDGDEPSGEDPAQASDALAGGREVLRDLLRALRLFGDGRVTLGELAWMRPGGEDSRWRPLPLGEGGRPHGMLVVTAEQEDELRAFCNLVSRRAPHANELAWALRRFELGCERSSTWEALSDHLMALRALLEPEGPASGLLAGRVAALCATPENRLKLTQRMTRALELERAVIAGTATQRARDEALAGDVSDHLRALLRDVICGHLAVDLLTLADELLLAPDEPSGEELPGKEGEAGEVLDVLV
jgi:hypothetical protein